MLALQRQIVLLGQQDASRQMDWLVVGRCFQQRRVDCQRKKDQKRSDYDQMGSGAKHMRIRKRGMHEANYRSGQMAVKPRQIF